MTYFVNTLSLIIVSSHSQITLRFCKFILFLLKNHQLIDLKVAIITLPKQIKKLTLIKSPHIYKTARTQLETRQVKTVLTIANFTPESNRNCLYLTKLILKHIPLGIKLTLKKKQLIFV